MCVCVCFVAFQLTTVCAEHGAIMPTQMMLCEHAEKLEAAKALYELHLE